MPVKRDDPDDEPTWHRWGGGRTWVAHPDEEMERASHALVVDVETDRLATGDGTVGEPAVWLVDPVDAAGLDDRLAGLGPVAGVVVLAGYHRRDAAAVAERHGVAVRLPRTVARLASRLDAPVQVFEGTLPGTRMQVIPLYRVLPWREAALYDEASGTLVATEALVTSDRLTGPGERLAVSPFVRLWPPRAALAGLDVDRVLVGHGPPVLDDARPALDRALASARRGLPAYLRRHLGYAVRAAYVAMRD